jgi:hypothetical protein
MYNTFLLFVSIIIFTFSCQFNQNKVNENSENHQDENNIELNNGHKWHVDEAMMLIIKEMDQIVANFNDSNTPAYKLLGDSIMTKINLLTSNCTMQGKAHDELHKWLVPLIELVDELSDVDSVEKGEKYYKVLQNEFKRFDVYFE